MVFSAHTFETQQAAADAVDVINQGEGYPGTGRATTAYTRYYNHEDTFYIVADDVTRKYFDDEEPLTIVQ